MTRLRLLVALPLALLVALMAHAVGFGAEHAAGGTFASAIEGVLAAALALCALVATFAAALGAPRRTIATHGPSRKLWFVLAAGGFAAYAGLERLEGHAVFAAAWALLAIVPSSLVVDVAVRYLVRRCAAVGRSLAALGAAVVRAAVPPVRRPALVKLRATDRSRGGVRRGRAPPPHR